MSTKSAIQWALKNPEKVREKSRRCYLRHKEKVNVAANLRRQLHPEKHREASRRWKLKHPKESAQHRINRRARLRGAEGSHTVDQWLKLVEHYNHACYYCGRTDRKLTRDHIVPLSHGGENYIWNIVPACQPCNSRKGTRV